MGHRPSLLRRLTASAERLDADELRDEVVDRRCVPTCDIKRGEKVQVVGRLRAVVYTPSETVPTLTAELFDGSSCVELVWLGRRRIAGLEPGRRVMARGRVGEHFGIGVVIGAVIASRTGEARGYFLLGIWTSFLYAVPFAISVVVRRPLVGLLWEFLDPTPGGEDRPWHRTRPLLLAYTWATLAATLVFLARGIVQLTLYGEKHTGWLAFARIAMGYPLFIAAVGFAFLVVTRARKQLNAPAAD